MVRRCDSGGSRNRLHHVADEVAHTGFCFCVRSGLALRRNVGRVAFPERCSYVGGWCVPVASGILLASGTNFDRHGYHRRNLLRSILEGPYRLRLVPKFPIFALIVQVDYSRQITRCDDKFGWWSIRNRCPTSESVRRRRRAPLVCICHCRTSRKTGINRRVTRRTVSHSFGLC